MEGGLFLHGGWFLAAIFVWVYRRWFEKVAESQPEFERFCAGRPLLASFSLAPNSEACALAVLASHLARGETVATLGRWPWIHYAVRVECTWRPGTLLLTVTGCRLLRTRELPPCALGTALSALGEQLGADLLDSWLHPDACVDLSGGASPIHGWHLGKSRSNKTPFTARELPLGSTEVGAVNHQLHRVPQQ